MKKFIILVAFILTFCMVGCSNTYAKEEYNSVEKIADCKKYKLYETRLVSEDVLIKMAKES